MGEAAGIIRTWWREHAPDTGWHMGRELSIWKRLVRLDDPDIVNGAMTMLPMMAPNLRPTLKLFYGKKSTPLYEQCKGEWLKNQRPAVVEEESTDLTSIAGMLARLTA